MIPADSLFALRRRLDALPARSGERSRQVSDFAQLYGISAATVYRALAKQGRLRSPHRSDRGRPRALPKDEAERYCEIIAALKMRTTNKQGRRLSTARCVELLETFGVETTNGLVKAPPGLLRRATVDMWLRGLRLDQPRIAREPVATRFQAERSNDCWQFDMSSSDLKHLKTPPAWVDPAKGQPTLTLFSVVDDRSGAAYMEYRCVYGEDAESALRFFFNAMGQKADPAFPMQGRPKTIYLDNGPVAKSQVFQNVMLALGIAWQTHVPAGKDGSRTTARSKGKVERPFRTVKEAHETLYHFHEPETEQQANEWLSHYITHTYNQQKHRSEPHSRIEDWLASLPDEGAREMCDWEQYCQLAREPQRRKVGADARITVDGAQYEVEPDMAGETVVLLWGLFDDELHVEFDGQRHGPYHPVSGPIPLHKYRSRRGKADERAERVRALADQLGLPISALSGSDVRLEPVASRPVVPKQPFDTAPFEYCYPSRTAAKLALADELARPLAKLPEDDREFIDRVLSETMVRSEVLAKVRAHFQNTHRGANHAG